MSIRRRSFVLDSKKTNKRSISVFTRRSTFSPPPSRTITGVLFVGQRRPDFIDEGLNVCKSTKSGDDKKTERKSRKKRKKKSLFTELDLNGRDFLHNDDRDKLTYRVEIGGKKRLVRISRYFENFRAKYGPR